MGYMGSGYNIPKAIYYLLKGDFTSRGYGHASPVGPKRMMVSSCVGTSVKLLLSGSSSNGQFFGR